MKIFAASDHAGVALRTRLVERLRANGHEVVDFGPVVEDPTDYPDWAARVGRAVRDAADARGLLVCGTGIGVAMSGAKVRGVRAAAPWSTEVARLARAHNDANVLCLGARFLDGDTAAAICDVFLATPFDGGRHGTRVNKIAALEVAEAAAAAPTVERSRLQARDLVARIWARDPRAFTPDRRHDRSIGNRLGWLRAPEAMAAAAGDLAGFAADVRAAGFRGAVLLGMGGSSLAPEVLAHTFGWVRGIPVHVLDNTDPAAVAAVERAIDPEHTLFIVASKSGTTIEVSSFQQYFWARALERHGHDRARAGAQFVAITDEGTRLQGQARENAFRHVFVNPTDVGGRYSALTYFGLVPAALLGVDVARLLATAGEMAARCRESALDANPGADLGVTLGAFAKQGRDKLSLVLSPEIASFGSWVEQLVAESTGKEGKGILPVDCEPIGDPALYGDDRVFVVVRLAGSRVPDDWHRLEALRAAGHPVLTIEVPSREHLGAEFFRWEMATAVAGAVLGVNPFDEPNVTEAKVASTALIDMYRTNVGLPRAEGAVGPDDATAVQALLGSIGAGDYLALCAFFHRTPERHELLTRIRLACRERVRAATTLGYGPRFLHSTGQLHKGGPASGVFIQIVGEAAEDIAIPGEGYPFGVLRDAQALGDYHVLQKHGRRVLRVQLGREIERGLERLLATVAAPGAGH